MDETTKSPEKSKNGPEKVRIQQKGSVYRHYTGPIIQDLEFGTFLKKTPQRQNLGLNWDFFGTIFIPFWDF